MKNSLSVGWVGLGDQGLPMARAVAAQGFPFHVWARRSGSLDGLTGVRVTRHETLADLAAASDIVGVCVGTDDDVAGLLRGGLLANLKPGSVVVNHGTGTPENARRFTRQGAEAGVEVLDAPVSGGRPAAEERRLVTLVGGAEAALEQCRMVFDSFSTRVVRLGGPGTGQAAKLFNNALLILNEASIADIAELAAGSDIDPARLFEVLRHASANSTVLGLINTMITPQTVDHLAKVQGLDVDLFDEAMRDAGLDATAVTQRARSGNDRLPAVVRMLAS